MIRDPELNAVQTGVRRFAEMTSDEKFKQIRRIGLIRDDMSMQGWNAYLAALEVREAPQGRAIEFWCLTPTLSTPGTAKSAISHSSMAKYL